MSWLVIDDDGGLAAILSADPGALEARTVIEADIPATYPELADWDGALQAFVPSAAKALAQLRVERDRRLAGCDWTQLADVPDTTRDAWQPYRQALRDLPETTDPFAPAWPAAPEI